MIDLTTLTLSRQPDRERAAVWGKWNREPRLLKSYAVALPDGTAIGRVFQDMTTFDIKPKGARIVTRRWESPRWYAVAAGQFRRGHPHETRKAALESLRYAAENPS
ncbi:hypothetical protein PAPPERLAPAPP_03770 [Brevundimonas phage vB_BpoS-Papperlapapp]|uniref:Uncharacterized protein n=1 Tax=Brevundimonas phage vB_BpoS-Kabachok TaxID=2948600 RepID=A0A9E7SJV3_9CAUD|nr:hypothetical protein KABACHOK_02150 [Brevundimonas phage vB_BpoS-Kabachok]USN16118.1 hypothetical protein PAPPERLAPAPP_03770 [Brevundimonas phage vB_BpoS-Papperlapapp]